jgi:uncharacterized phage protein gp47/JayE
MPLANLSATIDETGIYTPQYVDILQSLMESFRGIYGQDVDLAADTQDGQWLAILAKAIYDSNNMAVATYNSFSPTYALGAGLSSLVKINGIKRKTSSFSTVVVTIGGTVGTEIFNGAVSDILGQRWLLPAYVVIPISAQIDVTATSGAPGAITTAANTVTTIDTIVPGWYTVNNLAPASPGAPVESDALLRQRQAQSTAIAARSPVAAILAAVLSVDGVTRAVIYENDTDGPDSHGIPAHSISAVVEGGDVAEIAKAICYTKSPGCGTYGTTTYLVIDPIGIPDTTNFFVLTPRQIYYRVALQPLMGFIKTIGDTVMEVMAAYINSLGIGETIYHNRLWSAANLQGEAATSSQNMTQIELDKLSATYNIAGISLSPDGVYFTDHDLYINFDEAPITEVSNGALGYHPIATPL